MTDVQDIVQVVEKSPEFQTFNAANPHHYLVHAFSTGKDIELGYYGRETDKITVFKTNPLVMMPPEEIFKQQGTLAKLEIDLVRIGLQEAILRTEKERANAYPHHTTMKHICILQQGDEPMWNITLVTNTMQMINMKLSAQNGEIRSREMRSIMDIAKE